MEILKLLLGKPGSSTNYEIIDKNFFKVKYINSPYIDNGDLDMVKRYGYFTHRSPTLIDYSDTLDVYIDIGIEFEAGSMNNNKQLRDLIQHTFDSVKRKHTLEKILG